jgi:hypothetical protein
MSEEIAKAIDNLQRNPLFQMSLGSKELFHSNLLAWMIERDSNIANQILHDWSLCPNKLIQSINVEREKYHVDLLITIKFTDSTESLIIIENKLKSIPYKEQLEKYSKVIVKNFKYISDKHFILLSLTEPSFNLPDNWHYKDYNSLADSLKKVTEFESVENEILPLNEIVKAYVNFLKNLHTIISRISKYKQYDFYAKENDLFKAFKDIRINDLILKLIHQKIGFKIRRVLARCIEEEKNLPLREKSNEVDLTESLDYYMGTGFSRATGVSDFKILLTSGDDFKYILGIQLQEKQFRFVSHIITNKNDLNEKHIELVKQMNQDGLWLLGRRLSDGEWLFENKSLVKCLKTEEGKKGIGKGRSDHHPFCEYFNGKFIYSYDYLSDTNSIEDIVNGFIEAAKYIIKNKTALIEACKILR